MVSFDIGLGDDISFNIKNNIKSIRRDFRFQTKELKVLRKIDKWKDYLLVKGKKIFEYIPDMQHQANIQTC